MDETNQRITSALDHANIPIVLLDRCFLPYPARSKFDLVGIDNRRTAFGAVEHLINAGARKVAFLSKPFFASTVAARIAGYREALLAHGHSLHEDLVLRADPSDEKQIRSFLSRHKPDAFLCANDQMAAKLMQTLMNLDIEIPKKIRLMGIDDVKYASLLPIPLTTQRQPCLDIGRVAMTAMLDRIQTPDQPVRDILLSCELIVRKSCGSNAAA
jgi:DNA-binding LacI/PurR family transcriptional regulator